MQKSKLIQAYLENQQEVKNDWIYMAHKDFLKLYGCSGSTAISLLGPKSTKPKITKEIIDKHVAEGLNDGQIALLYQCSRTKISTIRNEKPIPKRELMETAHEPIKEQVIVKQGYEIVDGMKPASTTLFNRNSLSGEIM